MTPMELEDRMQQLLHDPESPCDAVKFRGELYAWQALRWEADTPLSDAHRAALLRALGNVMAMCGPSAAVFPAQSPDDLTLLVCHTRFPAQVHRATAMWLSGHLLIDGCSEAAGQEGTLKISEEFHLPQDWRQYAAQAEEAHAWWFRHAPMPQSVAHRHRTALQTLLKRRQYASMAGYVTRALRGEQEPGMACFGFVPVVIEAVWSQTADAELKRLIENLNLTEMTRKPREALFGWLAGLPDTLRACKPVSDVQPIQRVVRAIEADCSLPYSHDNLSRSIGVSPAYFCRLFKEETGLHFSSYLMRVRIGHAKKLLEQGGKSLQEIGALCGYPNKSYFCQVFKRHTGQTPGEYEAMTAGKKEQTEK